MGTHIPPEPGNCSTTNVRFSTRTETTVPTDGSTTSPTVLWKSCESRPSTRVGPRRPPLAPQYASNPANRTAAGSRPRIPGSGSTTPSQVRTPATPVSPDTREKFHSRDCPTAGGGQQHSICQNSTKTGISTTDNGRRCGDGTQTRPWTGGRLPVMGLIVALLVIWLVLAVLGFIIHSLLWLAWVAIILFVVTAVVGWIRRRAASR